MTIAPRHSDHSTPGTTLPALLWPGCSAERTAERRLDPAHAMAQNRAYGAAQTAALRIHPSAGTDSLTDPLLLTLYCPTDVQAALKAVLAPFGDRMSATLHAVPAGGDIAATIEEDQDGPRLVFYTGLAAAIEQGLTQPGGERELAAHVEAWRHQSLALLDAVGKDTVLIPAEALQMRPQAVQQALAATYNLSHTTDAADPDPADTTEAGPAPRFAVMASTLAQTDPKIMAVLDQLASHSLTVDGVSLGQPETALNLRPNQDNAGHDDLRAAHARDLRRVEGLAEVSVQRLRHQTDTARLRLLEAEALSNHLSEDVAQSTAVADYLKEELTRRETVYAAQTAEVETLRNALGQLEIARKAVSRKGNRLESEIDGLTRNVSMRDDRLKGLAAALVGYEDEALALRDETRDLHEEVAALRRSTSWRITSPLRGCIVLLRKVLGRG